MDFLKQNRTYLVETVLGDDSAYWSWYFIAESYSPPFQLGSPSWAEPDSLLETENSKQGDLCREDERLLSAGSGSWLDCHPLPPPFALPLEVVSKFYNPVTQRNPIVVIPQCIDATEISYNQLACICRHFSFKRFLFSCFAWKRKTVWFCWD